MRATLYLVELLIVSAFCSGLLNINAPNLKTSGYMPRKPIWQRVGTIFGAVTTYRVDGSNGASHSEIQFKYCPTCKLTKLISEFSRSKRSKDGFYWECKSCKSIRDKRDYEANKEKRLAHAREWKHSNKDKVQEVRQQYKPRRRELERLAREKARQERIESLGLSPWQPFERKPSDE